MAEKDMVGLVDGETTYNFKDAAARLVSGSPANLTQWKKFFTDNFTGTVPKTLILTPTANFSAGNAIASMNCTYLFVYRPGQTVATGYFMSYTNVRYDSHGVCTCTLDGATLTLGPSAIVDDVTRLRHQYGSVWSFSTLAEIKAALYSMYDETSVNGQDIFSSEAPLVFTLDDTAVTFDNGTVIPAYAQVIIYGHEPTDDGYAGIATGRDGTFYTLTTTYPDDSMTINAYAVTKKQIAAATTTRTLTAYSSAQSVPKGYYKYTGSFTDANDGHFTFSLNNAPGYPSLQVKYYVEGPINISSMNYISWQIVLNYQDIISVLEELTGVTGITREDLAASDDPWYMKLPTTLALFAPGSEGFVQSSQSSDIYVAASGSTFTVLSPTWGGYIIVVKEAGMFNGGYTIEIAFNMTRLFRRKGLTM